MSEVSLKAIEYRSGKTEEGRLFIEFGWNGITKITETRIFLSVAI